jgi:hypothetical protein
MLSIAFSYDGLSIGEHIPDAIRNIRGGFFGLPRMASSVQADATSALYSLTFNNTHMLWSNEGANSYGDIALDAGRNVPVSYENRMATFSVLFVITF